MVARPTGRFWLANPWYDDCGFGHGFTYNAWWCVFGGTSAACPLVSARPLFCFLARPDLTSAQVYDVIRYSAQTILKSGDTIVPPDDEYGYGRVDAYRALLAVCRGDVNNDKLINALDITYFINYLYKGGPAPKPDRLIGDTECDGTINATDITYLVFYVYHGFPGPPHLL